MRIGVAIAVVLLVAIPLTLYWKSQSSFHGATYQEKNSNNDSNNQSAAIVERDTTVSPVAQPRQDYVEAGEGAGKITRGDEKPILGQKVRLREIREGGELVNLEFVIRRGILPRRLFTDETRRILRYDELHYNNVGYGAVTVWLLYQLESETGVDVAVSRPDGSDFQILVAGLEKVVGFEHFPAQNRVSLEIVERGSTNTRSFRLPVN